MKYFLRLTVWGFLLGTLVASAFAQQRAQRPITPRARPAVLDGAVAIISWDERHNQTAEKLGQTLKPVVDAIVSGATLSRSDAARIAQSPEEVQRLQAFLTNVIQESRWSQRLKIWVNAQDVSSGGTQRQNNKCLICGSDQHAFCYRLLDYEKVELQEFPIDDPELSCLCLSNGVCAPPGCGGGAPGSATGGTGGRLMAPGRSVVVFLLADNLQQVMKEKETLLHLLKASFEEVLTGSPRLTIKVKSSPPYRAGPAPGL
jgi:hypothetical protein